MHYLAMQADAGGAAADVEPNFAGDGRRFVRLLVKGGLLQLVTFGFYRFWLLTDIRRHLWSATSIDGDALEYTGRGRELAIGFLFAAAVLGPVFLVYFLLGVEAERYQAFASLPLYLILFLFGQFAAYRARRYRLTRTVWRGVRFWMAGSGWSYAFRALLWSAFAYLTLGLAYPWRTAALERYKMRNTYYGDMPGAFAGAGWGLFKKGFWIWLILFGMIAVWIAWIVVIVANAPVKAGADGEVDLGPGAARIGIGGASIIALAFVLAWPIYQAIEWRWWAEGVRIGPVEMTSTFPRAKILTLYLKTVAWSMIGGMVGGVIFIAFAMTASGHIDAHFLERSKYVVTALVALGYLLALMAFGIVWRFYMQHQFWRAFVHTLTIRNLEATQSVSARGEAANAFGEGLLDGLDMGGF